MNGTEYWLTPALLASIFAVDNALSELAVSDPVSAGYVPVENEAGPTGVLQELTEGYGATEEEVG